MSVDTFAEECNIPLFEVSTKDGTNIELATTHMIARVWKALSKSSEELEGH